MSVVLDDGTVREIAPGSYRHFKGRVVRVTAIAEAVTTGEQLVIYRPVYGEPKYFAMPLKSFASEVDREQYPDTAQKYQFERDE